MSKDVKDIVAGLRMNNRQMVMGGVLTMLGADEEVVAEAKGASRVTSALITRCFKPFMDETEDKETPEPKESTEEAPECHLTEDSDKLTVGELKALVAEGKVKKAKKAFKRQFGEDYPDRKALKKEIFGGKKVMAARKQSKLNLGNSRSR